MAINLSEFEQLAEQNTKKQQEQAEQRKQEEENRRKQKQKEQDEELDQLRNIKSYILSEDFENWLENSYVHMYAKNKESLAANIEETNYNMWSSGYCSIQEVIEHTDKEFVKEYFDGDIPTKVNANTLADMLIKYGIYS